MPTANLQVSASAGDAHEKADGTGFASTFTELFLDSNSAAASRYNGGLRFASVAIPFGARIDSATLEWYVKDNKTDSFDVDVYGQAVDNASDFATDADVTSRTPLTTATVGYSAVDVAVGWATVGDAKAIVSELVSRAGWASGNAIVLIVKGRTGTNRAGNVRSYDYSGNTFGPKLTVVWTAAKTLSGSVGPAGAVVKRTRRSVAGSVGPAGTAVRLTRRVLTGALTPVGAIVRKPQRTLAGTVTPVGDIPPRRLFRTLTGTVTPAGTKQVRLSRRLTATLTPVGNLVLGALGQIFGARACATQTVSPTALAIQVIEERQMATMTLAQTGRARQTLEACA